MSFLFQNHIISTSHVRTLDEHKVDYVRLDISTITKVPDFELNGKNLDDLNEISKLMRKLPTIVWNEVPATLDNQWISGTAMTAGSVLLTMKEYKILVTTREFL